MRIVSSSKNGRFGRVVHVQLSIFGRRSGEQRVSIVIYMPVYNDDWRPPRAEVVRICKCRAKGCEPQGTVVESDILPEGGRARPGEQILQDRRRSTWTGHPTHLAIQTTEGEMLTRRTHGLGGEHMCATLIALLRQAANRNGRHGGLIKIIEVTETKHLFPSEAPEVRTTHAVNEGPLAAYSWGHAKTAAHRNGLLPTQAHTQND